MTICYVGVDLAKDVFQLCGMTANRRVAFTRRIRRNQLLAQIAQLPACQIGLEACTGAFYWQRQFERLGHQVKIISPQYVKPFVKGQKNDGNDAEAIAIALTQPTMRFVPSRSVEQQDIQALHRARQRLVNHRTATVCQIRGLLLDRGFPIRTSVRAVMRAIPELLEDADNGLSAMLRETIAELDDLVRDLTIRIQSFDRKIAAVFHSNADCQRIARVLGVGPKTATAIVAAVGDGREFKNGRHFSAWLGLVPRQHSSGDRRALLGITKRGDRHLRTLLVHGARAVVRTAQRKDDPFSTWVNELKARRGANKATVAVANKNARVIWALLRHGGEYHAPA